MATDVITTRKQELAGRIGVQPERIHSVTLQLNILRQQGLLVDLDVSGTGMFSRLASWAEIGVQQDENDPRFTHLTRGQKYLIPEFQIKRLRSVETRMRQWLDRLSYDVTGFRPFRWLPFTAYQEWRGKWDELLAEFNLVKSDIIARYDQYVDDLADDFAQVAEASWKAITAQGYEWAIVGNRGLSHDEFVDYIVHEALAKMPSLEKVQTELKADYITALVYGQEDIAADQERAENIRHQAQLEREAERAKRREELVRAQMAEEEQAHQRRMHQTEQYEREMRLEAMRQAEAEHAREQLKQIASPFEEVFTALRRQIAQDAVEMLASIRKNGQIRGKVAERGLGLIQTFDLLAVQNDYELRGKLQQLKAAIGPVGTQRSADAPERSTDEVVAILEQIRDLEHEAVKDLTRGPSRFSLVEF